MEEGDEDKVAKLNCSLYGMRDAAQTLTEEYTELNELGFSDSVASSCNFVREEKELDVTVHGDDSTSAGPTGLIEMAHRKNSRKLMKSKLSILGKRVRDAKVKSGS